MKKSAGALFVALILLITSGQAAFGVESLTICGTGDSQALLRAVARQFEASHGHGQISVLVPDSIGSGGGIRAAAAGKCELGRVARPLKKKEHAFNLNYRLFARAPVVFVVHPSVTWIDSLTDEQIVAIYSGTLSNWQQLGGPDAKIYVANREAGDSSRTVIEKMVSGFGDIDHFAGQELFNTPKTVAIITTTRNTIGYLPLSAAQHSNLRILRLNNVVPSPENVRNGNYPVVVPLGLVWKGELTGLAADFLEHLISPQGHQQIITDHGAIPVKP